MPESAISEATIQYAIGIDEIYMAYDHYLYSTPAFKRRCLRTAFTIAFWSGPVFYVFMRSSPPVAMDLVPTLLAMCSMFGWTRFWQKRMFPKRQREYLEKMHKDMNVTQFFGPITKRATDEGIYSSGPSGYALSKWSAVLDVTPTDDVLYLQIAANFVAIPRTTLRSGSLEAFTAAIRTFRGGALDEGDPHHGIEA